MNNSVLARHERDILILQLEKKGLAKKIKSIDAEIESLRNYNREILGRVKGE